MSCACGAGTEKSPGRTRRRTMTERNRIRSRIDARSVVFNLDYRPGYYFLPTTGVTERFTSRKESRVI